MGETVIGPPPDDVVDCANAALSMARDGFGPITTSGLQVAAAIISGTVTDVEVRAIRAHTYDLDTVTAGLFGGHAARAWLDEATILTRVAAPVDPSRPNLAGLSARLNAINARFRDRVETVVSQSMRQAVRHAMRKANLRAHKAATYKIAAVRAEFNAGQFNETVLAAIGTDPVELFANQFDDATDHVVALFDRRQRDRRAAILASGLDIDDDEMESWTVVEDQRRDTLRGFVFGGLMGAASAYLADPSRAPSTLGEVPRDVFAPPDVVAGAVRVADGAQVTAGGQVTEPDGVSLPSTFDYTDQLVSDLLAKHVGKLVTTYEWVVGEPARPFEPHQELSGVTFTDDTWQIVCANPSGSWPDVTLLPGDHDGCQCSLNVLYADGDSGED